MEIVSVDITNCMFFVVHVYQALCSTYDLRWHHAVCFTWLPAALLNLRPPGAPSFVARRKIEEKGVPKGSKAALWILAFNTGVWRGDVRTFLRIRIGAIYAIKSAAALRLFPCLCVLRPDGGASASPEEVPLGCGAVEKFRLQLQSCLLLRTSAHTDLRKP